MGRCTVSIILCPGAPDTACAGDVRGAVEEARGAHGRGYLLVVGIPSTKMKSEIPKSLLVPQII